MCAPQSHKSKPLSLALDQLLISPDTLSALLSLFFSSVYLLLPFFALRAVAQPRGLLFWRKKCSKYRVLFETMNREKSVSSGLFYPLFMFHRLIFIANVFILPPLPQLLAMIICTLLFLLYLVLLCPFKAKSISLFRYSLTLP